MIPFKAPLDDILFCLAAAGADTLPDWDAGLAAEIAGHFAAFAEGEIAPLDAPGDAQGCRLENGRVRMPDGFPAVYRAYADMGWPGLTAPKDFGGQGLPPLMGALTSEIFTGANHSLQMVTGLVPGAIRTLLRYGTGEQKARLIPPLVSGEALSTMCLTEPGAGSDLSRVRCRAVPEGEGWRITGEKIFISGGDQDLSDDILHLILARTSDDGLKGLSLFAATRRAAGGTIRVTRIEEKMGLHASPTCQLAFEDAPVELVGAEGQGLEAMFTMMSHARADVALQGVAHAARAYQVTSAYAAERKQGRLPDGSPARLDQHADVARMIDRIDQLAMGARAMAHLSFVALERGDDPALVGFLTPLAKVHCTEAGIEAANLGIQVLGGYGYLREYRLEQTFRDARVTAIYEGTNGIHERSLATRLLTTGASDAFQRFVAADPGAAPLLSLWSAARGRAGEASAHDFAALSAAVLLDVVWRKMAAMAANHPDPARIRRLAAEASRQVAAEAGMRHALISGQPD
jgi:alkylation response protein AidB-like acyl-CoA dehydrogenase